MYTTLENLEIKLDDLTAVIHFVVKILNKHKTTDNHTQIKDLPIRPQGKSLEICNQLLNEIDIDSLNGQDDKINVHINNLYNILNDRFSTELKTDDARGKALLEKLKES